MSNVIFKSVASVVVLFLLGIAGYLAYLSMTPVPGYAKIKTRCGWLRGRSKDGSYSFKGIPYAVQPVGEHRWKPPQEPKCWKEVYDATHFQSVCTQVLRPGGEVIGQENCLHLSVWTPSLDATDALPVMVWIHGGDLQTLSGQEKGYSPSEELATQTQTVFVSMNYRLNVFGFMAVEMFREGFPNSTSGNYGVLDQIQALRWVQKNIHVFGGDPTKVTIFGGTSVWGLMGSQLAKGLFHRAIDMSGSFLSNTSLEMVEKQNMEFLKRTSCHDAACLQQLRPDQVLQAVPWQEFPSWVQNGPDSSTPSFKGRYFNDVPLVVGMTEKESDLSCRKNHMAKQAAGVLKSPVYYYLVTFIPSNEVKFSIWRSYPTRSSLYILHVLALFGGLKTANGTMSAKDRAFQDTLTTHFIHFAKEGKMTADWKRFPPYVALLDVDLSVTDDPLAEKCAFWKDYYF